jgi:hypothetical protein
MQLKSLLPYFIFFLHLAGYSQNMNSIQQVKKVLALDARQLKQLDRSAGDFVYIPSGDSCFLGTDLSLLPDQLGKHFLSEVSFQPLGSEAVQKHKTIIRLIQEDMNTKRMDFYSRQLKYSEQAAADSLIIKGIKEEIRKGLIPYQWLEQPSEQALFLKFRREELEMTIMLETLPDVEHFPFWHQLNNNFHIHQSHDHTPVLNRFAHFVIRTSTRR